MSPTATQGLSGLSDVHRVRARDLAVRAAHLSLAHAGAVHYSQGPQRWEGIDHDMKAWRGEYPDYTDCSASATWWLWNGLDHFGVRDVVNGASWRAGYTGTMVNHGVRVNGRIVRCDLVLYGDPFGGSGHVAMVVGRNASGVPMVISHGSEAGPFLLPYNYRPVTQVRRYI